MIKWNPPPTNQIKLNVNKALKRNPNYTSCEGIIRNNMGSQILGYTYNLGICRSFEAKMWGILEGLKLARSMGFKQIIVESNFRLLVDKLN